MCRHLIANAIGDTPMFSKENKQLMNAYNDIVEQIGVQGALRINAPDNNILSDEFSNTPHQSNV